MPASPVAKEIAAFEEAAQQMLRRMEVMLVTVKGVGSEKDPGRRLEVLRMLSVYGLAGAQSLARPRGLYPLRTSRGARRNVVVKALCYKLEGRWFET
jgi:hypothetical protein